MNAMKYAIEGNYLEIMDLLILYESETKGCLIFAIEKKSIYVEKFISFIG